MERGTPGYELVDKTEDLFKGILRKLDPFAAEKAVMEENREGRDPDSTAVERYENRWGQEVADISTDVLSQIAVGSALKVTKPPSRVLRTYPPELTGTTNTVIPKYSSGQVVQTSEGPKIRLDPGTLNITPDQTAVLYSIKNKLNGDIDGPQLPPNSDELNRIAAQKKLDEQLKRMDEAVNVQQKQSQKNREQFARVLKRRIRTYVEEFKGSDADINEILEETKRIYRREGIVHASHRKAVRWLNSYFNKLGREISEDGLSIRQLRIADVNGRPRLVHDNASGKGVKIYKSAFEKDHVKAKTIFEQLAKLSEDPELFAGANFSDNLETVLTVFNRAKKDLDIQGITIPDEVLRATGSSTTLRELVRRNLDPEYDKEFQRIPDRFRLTARKHMIEDIVNTKSKSITKLGIKRIVNKHLKWWDEFGDLMVQIDDYVPADVQKQLDEDLKANPQEALYKLETMDIWSELSKSVKDNWRKLRDKFVQEEGGLRRRPTGKYYDEDF